jgi:hypothetical protein
MSFSLGPLARLRMPGSNPASPRHILVVLLGAFVIVGLLATAAMATGSAEESQDKWNLTLTQTIGYFSALALFVIGFLGPWCPKTHVVHHQTFRFLVWCAVFIFVLTLSYSMYIDLVR